VITGYLAGINLFQGPTENVIQGNYIGVAADGVTARPNGIGVLVYGAPNNTIGGATVADRNVISGNESTNITLQSVAGYGADENSVDGNYIGLDATGQNAVSPNALFGIFAVGGAAGNAIRGNVIAGHQQGVYIDETSSIAADSSQNCISGNVTYGVHSMNTLSTPFADNWWGDASGPRHGGQPGGVGDWVSDNVTFSPFLTSEPAACGG